MTARVARELTYREVGATAGELPAGYRHLRETVYIGRGEDLFLTASDALLGWDVHRRAGLRVEATSPTAEPGCEVLLRWFGFPIPCRAMSG